MSPALAGGFFTTEPLRLRATHELREPYKNSGGGRPGAGSHLERRSPQEHLHFTERLKLPENAHALL